MAYRVIVNAPGYLPDCDPVVFPSWEAAVLGLHEALTETQNALFADDDDHGLEDAALSVDAELRERPEPHAFTIMLCGLAHSIEEA